jgi:hypothetical protein
MQCACINKWILIDHATRSSHDIVTTVLQWIMPLYSIQRPCTCTSIQRPLGSVPKVPRPLYIPSTYDHNTVQWISLNILLLHCLIMPDLHSLASSHMLCACIDKWISIDHATADHHITLLLATVKPALVFRDHKLCTSFQRSLCSVPKVELGVCISWTTGCRASHQTSVADLEFSKGGGFFLIKHTLFTWIATPIFHCSLGRKGGSWEF